jgi:hypothetical protein
MIDEFSVDPERDEPDEKIWNLGFNKIRFRREDPFGFWYISLEKGNLPEPMKGSYTTLQYAENAANVWIHNKRYKISEEKKV